MTRYGAKIFMSIFVYLIILICMSNSLFNIELEIEI